MTRSRRLVPLGILLALALAAGAYVLSRLGPPDIELTYLNPVTEKGAGLNPYVQSFRLTLEIRNNYLASIDVEDFDFVLYANGVEAARVSPTERITIGPFASGAVSADASIRLMNIGAAIFAPRNSPGFQAEIRFKLNGEPVVHRKSLRSAAQ